MKKKFPIPKLDQENWEAIQSSLESVGRIISELMETEQDHQRRKELELASIHMGMLDMYLGRTLTFKELQKELDEKKKELAREKELNEKY